MQEDGKIDYIEWASTDLPATKAFYSAAFGWTFADYGPAYAAFAGQGVDGGFSSDHGPEKPLVVLYAHDLEAMQARVEAAGGTVVKPIFSFPGGRRFHFTDPGGAELAVWSQG